MGNLPQPENPNTHVVVAMSGGVDSSLAAALLLDAGYRVTGVMLDLWVDAEADHSRAQAAQADARRVADHLGMPFHLLDARAAFKHLVVDDFVATYAAGRTPNPCIACNPGVKFGVLLDEALALGAAFLATGHYARIQRMEDGELRLLMGVDPSKDQSYMLQRLTQRQLLHALFPLGELTKAQVRGMARARHLPVVDRPESQDLCFLPDGDYRAFLCRHAPVAMTPGPIVDPDGRVLGRHTGLGGYTIGQRQGLGIAAPHPLYVVRVDAPANALVVGPAQVLGRNRLTAHRVNYISGRPPASNVAVEAKIRYKATPVPAQLVPQPDGSAELVFARDLRDITPGQSVAFYQGEVLLGGGYIE